MITAKIRGDIGAQVNQLVEVVHSNISRQKDASESTVRKAHCQDQPLHFSDVQNGANLNLLNDQNNSLISTTLVFLASSIFAVLGRTTKLLDRFGIKAGTLAQYGLEALSLTLGTMTVAGYFSSNVTTNSPDDGR